MTFKMFRWTLKFHLKSDKKRKIKHQIMSSNHNHNQHFHGSVIKYLVVAKAVGKTREGVAGTKKKRNDKEKIETGFCSQTSGFRTHHRPDRRFLGECGFRWRMWVASVCPARCHNPQWMTTSLRWTVEKIYAYARIRPGWPIEELTSGNASNHYPLVEA